MGRRVLVLVCRGPVCGDLRNSAAIHTELHSQLAARPPDGVEVHLDWQSCFGKCARGVNVMVREVKPGEEATVRTILFSGRGGTLYNMVTQEEVERILVEHVEGGCVIAEFKGRTPLP